MYEHFTKTQQQFDVRRGDVYYINNNRGQRGNEIRKDRPAVIVSADFISCVAFGKTGQFFEKYGQQGTKFAVEGRIQTGSYTNREGRKVYTTDVVIETAEFAESKAAAGDNQSRPQPAPDSGDGFMNIPDGVDDLPFT